MLGAKLLPSTQAARLLNSKKMNVHTSILRTALLSVLRQEKMSVDKLDSISNDDQRRLLGDILVSSNTSWKEQTLQLIDQIYDIEKASTATARLDTATPLLSSATVGSTQVSVWQGDITRLEVDAIVNAANDQGLGCFQPDHMCIDNVIHRRSGPRLRIACRQAMEQRGFPLAAGTDPILTGGFHLPASHVLHVTGPRVRPNSQLTQEHTEALASAYEKSLTLAAQRGEIQSIAFPCISTGLFGFPADEAVKVALSTTRAWLEQNPNSTLKHIVFDAFTNEDALLYQQSFGQYFETTGPSKHKPVLNAESLDAAQGCLVKTWLNDADAVLICAGAGMSVKPGEMVYTNPDDFARAYPFFTRWGYRTSYETMGLEGDPRVPRTAKWALYAKHMDNMRWSFSPNAGYAALLDLVKGKDTFVLTSNVDACFERAGFPKERIYTAQGEWTHVQCSRACQPNSVFESRPILDRILPQIGPDGTIPANEIPKCPRCGGDVFGNVRADGNFLHHQYQAQNDKLRAWMEGISASSNKKVVILEIGAGFNTPTVTRLPVESWARELLLDHTKNRVRLVRINPTEAQIPSHLHAVSLAVARGWDFLVDSVLPATAVDSTELADAEATVAEYQLQRGGLVNADKPWHRYFGHFDWRIFLGQLKDRSN